MITKINMIQAIIKNLYRGVSLLNSINDNQYSDISVAPYFSSIGSHMRHILDVFDCIFDGLEFGKVDLTARKRNELAETKITFGIAYFEKTIDALNTLQSVNFDQIIEVTDDLGLGKITVNYTLASAFIQAHSHTIHHFASIGYVINKLGIELPDTDFGFNPTTPTKSRNQEIKN
ncbi:MAG: DinB family protein [Flavobacteriaceae bacterium]|nr:DinB family protein [Flavobacteriaceae bacterium]